MQNIRFPILFLISILLIGLAENASAAETKDVNLILGQPLVASGQNASGNVTNLTDGDTKSPAWMLSYTSYSYTFPAPVTIKRFVTYSAYQSTVIFYDGSGKQMGSVDSATNGVPNTKTTYYENVKRVVFKSTSNSNYDFVELELWGTKTSFNPDKALFVTKNLKATTDQMDKFGTVNLSWSPIVSDFFAAYRIYKDGTLLDSGTVSNYKVSGLEPGETYTFEVTSVDANDDEFPGQSIRYTVPVPDTTPPAAPILKGVPGDFNVNLEWTKGTESDLQEYRLYQDGVWVGTYGKNTVKTTIDKLIAGKKYVFYITAVDESGNESARSNQVELIPKDKPPPVTDSDQQETNDYLLVTWTETEGAVGYNIYFNGSLVGSVGPKTFEFKVTKAMGYRPGALNNTAEVRAVFADGSEGGGKPGGGNISDVPFVIGGMIENGMAWIGLFKNWIIVGLSIIFAVIIIDFLFYVMKRKRLKQAKGR